MTFTNIWPLLFLILIPVIILLYILKQRAKDQEFSSNILWSEIYKNIEARHPFEKLKYNILMYIQILLLLLLICALMAPVLRTGGKSGRNIILVIDNSASMEYIYAGEDTRLDMAKEKACDYVDSLKSSDVVTLISCNEEASVVYQGSSSSTIKARIKDIGQQGTAGTLDNSISLVNSLISDLDNVTVVCYTDTECNSDELVKNNSEAGIYVYSMYSEGTNAAIDYINYSAKTDEDNSIISTLCSITNYSDEAVTTDVSLYMDTTICDVKTVTLEAGSSTTVYFDNLVIDRTAHPVLKAELSIKDSLISDNVQQISVEDNSIKSVLLLSSGNVFLEKAFNLENSYEVYKSDSTDVLENAEEAFDLYVFDGIDITNIDFDSLINVSPDASFLFLNYDVLDIQGDKLSVALSSDSSLDNTVLAFPESDITKYVEDYTFGISHAYTYNLPQWASPCINTSDGQTAGFYGNYNNHMIGVIGFDIHDTDLALQTEFPVFMSQLEEALTGYGEAHTEITNFPSATESNVTAVDDSSQEFSGILKYTNEKSLRNILLVAVLILLVIEWIIYIRQVRTHKKLQYLVIRTIVMAVIILAMAGISITKKGKQGETVFVVDMSDSMADNTDIIQNYISETVAELPDNQKYAVVAFGKNASCWQFMTSDNELKNMTAQVTSSATNIEKAVLTAAGLFDENVSKQMVIVTDGDENEGSMNIAASALKGNDIELYGISMESSFGSTAEVYIDEVDAPDVIHIGDNFNVTVTVMSNVETNATLTLYEGRNVKEQQSVHVNKGSNKYVFTDTGAEGTLATYKAVIEPDIDTEYVNNTYVTYSEIDAVPKVLLVEGSSGEADEFVKVLKAANIDYDLVTPKGAPGNISDLTAYKAVITLDVYYDDLNSKFVNALESYVKDYAGGYICIGGENSYALGGYKGTVLEDILPVYMELQGEKQIPKLSMTMVIDHSGSMLCPVSDNISVTALTLAKQAALAGVSELRETDDIGVMAFDDSYSWVVPLDNNMDIDSIKDAIETIGEGGGTSIYPALYEACQKTCDSDAVLKHIILLTDGQDEFRDYSDIIKTANDEGITISTVAVGEDADKETLEYLAEQCGGRYYYTDISNSIPRIFAREIYLSTNTYLVNNDFYPVITSNNSMLSNVYDDGVPMMYGYVATTAKSTADVVLQSDAGDPILSTWQYGLGKTVAWCTDGDNQWTAEYGAWDNYPVLWSNIINYVIYDNSTGEDTVEIDKSGNQTEISFTTPEYDADTNVTAVISDDAGNVTEVSLNPSKPGTFETELDLSEVGVYSINIRKQQGDEVVTSYNTAYASQYSPEYRFSESDTDFISFIHQSGGSMITMEDNIWDMEQARVVVRKSLTEMLLIIAILLLLMDIAVRRLAVDVAGKLKAAAGMIVSNIAKPGHRLISATKNKSKPEKIKTMEGGRTEEKEQEKKQSEKKQSEKKQAEDMSPATLDMNALLQKKKDRE